MRRSVARTYDALFKHIDGVTTPYAQPWSRHVYHVYCIRTPFRPQLTDEFKKKGISAIIHYPIPLHLQKAYAGLGCRKGDYPVAEKIAHEVISLPMYPHMGDKEISYVVDAVQAVAGGL
jgi:dTDP-4-amino-4,6-dideoxygalactose transaminase